jgi:hypothetical protein
MENLRARFGYYTEYRFANDGILKVSLISASRLLAISFGGPFLIVPLFLITVTFYPSGVPAGPLLTLLVALTMAVTIGPALFLIFWSIRTRARTPDTALPANSVKFIPYSQVKELRILGRQMSIVTEAKTYSAALQSDSAMDVRLLEQKLEGRLSYGVRDSRKVRIAKLEGSLGSLLIVAVALWKYASSYSLLFYSADAVGLALLVAVLMIDGSLSQIANSTSGNWIAAHDWSIAGYYLAWVALGLTAAGLASVLVPETGRIPLFGTLVPVYTRPVFPNDWQGLFGLLAEVGLLVVAGLFLTWSFKNMAQRLRTPLFRAVGPAYIVCVLAFTLGGISLYPIFYVLQALAFLSMNVEKADSTRATESSAIIP